MTSDVPHDIAIVGMAARLPQADDLGAFFDNLAAGRDSVRPVSAERMRRTSLPEDESYQEFGYLDDIDTFDHAFFGFAKGEANNMAPQHRLLLQTACQAVDNAGYPLSSLSGQRGSVYVADTKIAYDLLAAEPEPTLVMGSHAAATAGRVSRFLGLRGPSAMIDSSCSSGLVAVHFAVNDLLTGDADIALSCAAGLNLFPDRLGDDTGPDIGIRSADGRTRCFSADADGTGSGEAVVVLVLKRLADALRDNDIIHSVLKGVAVNNVGGRSSMLTAPDADAEAEVLERAWRKARIDPATITYIEAHGTATRLGDPIEVAAIDRAFARATDRKRFCAISSAKSNIGHTWSASGLVGIVKATLALRNEVLFPNVHTSELSPLIDFENSAVVVTREFTPWVVDGHPHRAGVSSFGVMGTNAHAVLEQAPVVADRPVTADAAWIPVSAKSIESLRANLDALRRWLDAHPGTRLADLQATLVGGRDHYRYRYALTATDLAELRGALLPSISDAAVEPPETAVGLIVSGECHASDALVTALRRMSPVFERRYADCAAAAAEAGVGHNRGFAFQYALYGHFEAIGLSFQHVVGEGAGKLVLDACRGRVGLAEAVELAAAPAPEVAGELADRVDRLLGKLAGERVVFVEAGPLSTVSRQLAARGLSDYPVVAFGDGERGYLDVLARLYTLGVAWDWAATAGDGRRIELPPYQFQRIRCWIERIAVATERTERATADAPVRDSHAAVEDAWKRVLGLDTVDPDESFFDIGGDSISGLQVLNRIQSEYGIALDQFAIFDHETPRALAQHIDEVRAQAGAPAPEVVVTDTHGPFALSSAQQQIWVAAQFEGGSVAFNLTRSFQLDGPVDTEAMRAAVDQLLHRHAALRVAFTHHDDVVRQEFPRVRPAAPFTTTVEARALPEAAVVIAESRAIAERPFDLAQGQLFRAHLATFLDDQSVLTVSTHHLVADGWSLDILVRDLFALYRANATGTQAVLPDAGDYREELLVELEQSGRSKTAAQEYWLRRFAEVPAPIRLPARAGAARDFRGAYRTYGLTDGVWERLQRFTRAQSTSTFVATCAVFAAYFARHTDSGEVVLGTSLSGRNRESVEHTVGMFVRTVALRVAVQQRHSLKDLDAAVRAELRLAAGHGAFTYEELVAELRRSERLSAPHLFDVLIEFEQFAEGAAAPDAGPTATALPVTLETSVFPINIMLSEHADGLNAVIRYDTGLFDEEAIGLLWDGYVGLLEVLLAAPDDPLADLPLVGPRTHQDLLAVGYRSVPFDASVRIHHAIERFAATAPDRVCLIGPQGQRSFAELDHRANQMARLLGRNGIGAGDIVAVVLDRAVAVVESILAIWKCGAAYLPIDPKHPAAYAASVIEASGAKLALVDRANMPAGLAPTTATLLDLAEGAADTESGAELPRPDPEASGLAYVIYTSGSTGAPKGAMVEHAGMLNHLHAKIDDLRLNENSVVAQTASNSFDISVWQMFAAPFVGGRTVIYPESLQLEPISLRDRLECDGVTVLEVVPSYLAAVLDSWREHEIRTLEWLLVTGEVVQPKIVNDWLRAFPAVPVVNAYGPTEASDDITHHIITAPVDSGSVPLGRPIRNTAIYILDGRGRLVPRGEPGEICVSGVAVGRGYLHAPEQTARVFGPDPFDADRRMYRTGDLGRWRGDGTLELIGRKDNQVKVRGFRVDLGAIEHRVSVAPSVRACAVVTTDERDRLVAFVVREDPGAPLDECAAYLTAQLPHYMVPELIEIPRIPLTPNGKTDRKALERLGSTTESAAAHDRAPASAVEYELVRLWEEVLQRPVGVHDRFLDLGGNSLSAIRLLSRVRAELAAELTLADIFTHPTIAGLAAVIAPGSASAVLTSLGGPGSYPVAPGQRLLLDLESSSAVPAAFHRNDLFDVVGAIDLPRLRQTVAMLLSRHESLRTTYDLAAARLIVHPAGALATPVDSHELADEQAVSAFVAGRIDTPFDLTKEAPIRVDLLHTGSGDASLLISMHQLASDGRSVEVLKDELVTIYDGLSTEAAELPALPIQYKEFAAARRSAEADAARARAFWQAELAGASVDLALRTDYPRPETTTLPGARCYRTLPAERAAAFDELARRHGATGFVVARTAVALLLFAETGRTDLVIGTYARGRDRVEFEDQIGNYLSIVPMRLRHAADASVGEVLREAQREVLRAFAYQEYPYGSIMRDLGWRRGADRSPLFDVMIAFDEWAADPATHGRSFTLLPRELPRRAKEAELQITFGRTPDTLEIVITYNTELFAARTVEALADRLCAGIDLLIDEVPPAEVTAALATEGARL
ncbi:amino acid adenylation domain-containing protein [Nocardia brasiliensis]|uniref:Amino acid adenylation domain-containing protein n=1 Tax=Nocardia brasiliensis TaxID=37326 RepID=A0A6G9XTM0_NOCBR|nr:non-ribosomal peptide synthetase [Nocardia brasiliensis]QIS04247.1 amino acid adenylation domain-containing protein [Nocardia brasiliensis]